MIVAMMRESAARRQVDPEERGLLRAAGGRREARDRVARQLEGRMIGGAFHGHRHGGSSSVGRRSARHHPTGVVRRRRGGARPPGWPVPVATGTMPRSDGPSASASPRGGAGVVRRREDGGRGRREGGRRLRRCAAGTDETESLTVRNQEMEGIDRTTSSGVGVRVLVGGRWGFAATSRQDEAEVVRTATLAVEIAKAASRLPGEPVDALARSSRSSPPGAAPWRRTRSRSRSRRRSRC